MADKVETMAYAGETPWHGRGTRVERGVTVDQMREAAGLTWEPILMVPRYEFAGTWRDTPTRAMVRDDTGAVLDMVGPEYVPIKNAQVLEFFREYTEAGDLTLETAGSLDGGRYVWGLAKMEQSFKVGGGEDKVQGYVFLANPHRYGRSALVKFTAVRVVCWNTWQAALAGGGAESKIWHVADFDAARRTEVQAEMGIARRTLDDFKRQAERLADQRLQDSTARRLATSIFKADNDAKWEDAPRVVKRVVELYKGAGKGAALDGAAGTAWGLFNAVTQYVDWENGRTVDNRLRSAWFGGAGDRIKRRAMELLIAHAGGKKAG